MALMRMAYRHRGDAERAVDYLSDQRFEVNRVAIVGRELEYVEQILGRMNYGTAALRGASSGALVGSNH
jgi:Heat induced stress protein YflT domain